MNDHTYFLDCGGLPLCYSFIYPETRTFFGGYLEEGILEMAEKDGRGSINTAAVCSDGPVIRVTPEYMQENRWLVDEDEQSLAFLEFQALMLATGNALLSHRRALFHAAALLWKGYAWLITAPSGTGKTTQLRHWNRLLKKDVSVINGDKPLLECRDDGTFIAHASPWRGKERFGLQGLNAPLGGILLLKQGTENTIRRLSPEEAVRPLFTEFISFPEDTGQLLCQAEILEKMLDAVPVWELINLGDESSARLAQKTIGNYLEEAL